MSASPASGPISPDAGEKDKKYDRQLRLWGDHGQTALEKSSVCLINCSAVGCEILKSLVLAGLGSFTIVDDQPASSEDVDANFFLESDSVGEPRGQVACRLLLELNPDVRGAHLPMSAQQLVTTEVDRLAGYSAVVAAGLTDACAASLSELLWDRSVPLVVCQCCGLLGYIRVQVNERLVVESHPDSSVPDLRLNCPFPALSAHMDAVQLDAMNRKQHSHIPYAVLLYKCLQRWHHLRQTVVPPCGRAEKQEFVQLLQQMRLRNADGVPESEENFEEAEKAVNTCLSSSCLPSDITALFARDECSNLTAKSADFWVLLRAVREFVAAEGGGRLPVRGAVPDMLSDSQSYVQLQLVYVEQARRDCAAVYARLQRLLESLGRPADAIGEQQVQLLCRNTHALRHVTGSRLADELLRQPSLSAAELSAQLLDADGQLAVYILLRAVQRFRIKHGAAPGVEDQQLETDPARLKSCVGELLTEWGCSATTAAAVSDDYVQEVCRYGDAQIHSVAAMLGGCAAHEVVKLVTGQYVPVDNTFIYNGVQSASSVFKL